MTTDSFFTAEFIGNVLRQHYPKSTVADVAVSRFEVDNSASILVTLTSGISDAFLGHYGLQVDWRQDGTPMSRKMVMKVKPHGREISAMVNGLAQANGAPLADVYPHFISKTGFQNTHIRELALYEVLEDPILPEIYGTYSDAEEDVYIVLMEYLEGVSLLNSVMSVEQWSDDHILEALTQIANFHAKYFDQDCPLDGEGWEDTLEEGYMVKGQPLWEALIQNAAAKCPDLYTPERVAILDRLVSNLPVFEKERKTLPHTLVHNDLNPRNTCFKRDQFCVYDWELGTWHLPQYDVVEFLSFVLDETRYQKRAEFWTHYQGALEESTGRKFDQNDFMRGAELAAVDFGLHRLGLYMIAHGLAPYPFIPRVLDSYFDFLKTTSL